MKKAIFIIGSILLFATGKAQNWEVFKTSNSGIIGNNVQDIVKIGEYYYIGTTRGLSQFDGSNTWVNYDESNSNLYDDFITCVEKGPNNELYMGHFISGFSVFANGTFTRYNLGSIFSMYAGINSVEEIEVDDKGIVWIATHQGLVRYDGSNFSIINSSNSSMQYDNLRAIKYNPTHQKYYIGTLMEGLYVMDTNMQMTHYPFWTPQDIWNSTQVNRITVDLDNDVWMTGYGVIEFDGLTMTRKNAYTSNDGLGDPLCWGIAFDNQNRPWVGSDFLLGVFHDPGTGWISMDSVSHNFPAYNYSNFLGHSNNHVGLIKNIEDELWFCTWTGIVRLRNPTNVKDHSSYFQTKIYPNPTVGELIIESKKPINMISVFNVSGKLVAQISNIKSNRYKYDLFFLPKGIYTIRIENKDQNTEVQKLVLY